LVPVADQSLSEVPTDELIRLARQATKERQERETEAEATARRQGELIAEIVRRPGWTYLKVAQELGLDDSTAHRIAKRATE
jgi:transcriptional regulator with GAF, ATPase, and Fis domain